MRLEAHDPITLAAAISCSAAREYGPGITRFEGDGCLVIVVNNCSCTDGTCPNAKVRDDVQRAVEPVIAACESRRVIHDGRVHHG